MRHLMRLHQIPLRNLLPLIVLSAGPLLAGDARSEESLSDSPAAHARGTQAARLVEQLGSASYDRREDAAAQLIKLGAVALPPLRAAAMHHDLEIRYRAQRLVERIEQAEQQRILSEFHREGNLELGDALPGWNRFAKIAGVDLSARELFVAMYRAEPEIMRLSDRVGPELRETVEQRVLEFRQSRRQTAVSQMPPATVAVLLFVMLEPNLDTSGTAQAIITAVIGQQAVREALSSGDSAFRRLMSHWIAAAEDVSPTQRMMVAVQYGFDSGVVPSLEIIRSQARGTHLQNAVMSIAQLGGPENLRDLEPLLENDSVISERSGPVRVDLRTQIRDIARQMEEFELVFFESLDQAVQPEEPKSIFRSQVCDVALAAMIHLIGHDPQAYGFSELRRHKDSLYVPNTAGFETDEARQRALRQWKLWTKVQRLQSLDVDEIASEGVGL